MQCFCTEQPDPVLLNSPTSFPLNSAPDNKPLVPSRFHALLFPHWFTGCDWCSWLVLQLHTAPSLKKLPSPTPKCTRQVTGVQGLPPDWEGAGVWERGWTPEENVQGPKLTAKGKVKTPYFGRAYPLCFERVFQDWVTVVRIATVLDL